MGSTKQKYLHFPPFFGNDVIVLFKCNRYSVNISSSIPGINSNSCYQFPQPWDLLVPGRQWQLMRSPSAHGHVNNHMEAYLYSAHFDDRVKGSPAVRILSLIDRHVYFKGIKNAGFKSIKINKNSETIKYWTSLKIFLEKLILLHASFFHHFFLLFSCCTNSHVKLQLLIFVIDPPAGPNSSWICQVSLASCGTGIK